MNPVEQLKGQKIAVFDLEIKRTIEQCSRGWKSHDEMGISVLCLFDYATMRYRVFEDKTQAEAVDILFDYDVVAGFNITAFDWRVVTACWATKHKVHKSRNYDMLAHIWSHVGGFQKGYKLDDIAYDTLGLRKSGDGSEAPVLYQEGRIVELVDYCLEDVRIERALFEFAVMNGYVMRNGKQLTMPKL